MSNQTAFGNDRSISKESVERLENLTRETMSTICGGSLPLALAGAAQLGLSVIPSPLPTAEMAAFAGGTPSGGAETGGFNPAMFGD